MPETLLFCTVGGSHQPILTAIRECQPDQILFFCTGKDPATGKAGSDSMIVGKGTPIIAGRGEDARHLPNIPTQLGLTDDHYEVTLVPSDDLDSAVDTMRVAIARLRARFPQARCIADYTGGTKTMTAALAMAAVDSEGVDLHIVTGARSDLVRVQDGSQSGLPVSTEGIRLRRAMAPLLAAWQRFGYGEAATGLSHLPQPRDPRLRGEWQIARGLSQAFDAWDRFDHGEALALMSPYRPRIGARCGLHFTTLQWMVAADDPKTAPARLWDLWLNAQRRAAQGRYDDGVARLYRLLEWTAQWLLSRQGIVTADLQPEQIPPGLSVMENSDGKRQVGLRAAWQLASHHLGGEAAAFWAAESEHLIDHLKVRNYSILAHGDQPIGHQDWLSFSTWVEATLLPLLRHQAAEVGLKALGPQLPQQPPWGD